MKCKSWTVIRSGSKFKGQIFLEDGLVFSSVEMSSYDKAMTWGKNCKRLLNS